MTEMEHKDGGIAETYACYKKLKKVKQGWKRLKKDLGKEQNRKLHQETGENGWQRQEWMVFERK